jgi:dihydrofolate reductase
MTDLRIPRLVLLVAVAKRGVIGVNNTLPWHLPEDLKRFKEITTGKTVAMGRKTFDSIVARLGKPLPNRHSVVITRGTAVAVSGTASVPDTVTIVSNIADLLQIETDCIYVIGGAEIYQQTINLADSLDITEVDLDVEGDAFFPEISEAIWQRDAGPTLHSEASGLAYRFVTYRRRSV